MQEQEFLEGYELKNWDFSPRTYKILGLSAILNFSVIFILGQTNLLNSKACDSDYVGKVCQVLDTIYVGSKIFSGDTGYVLKDYTKTAIDDADVVWVDQTGVEPKFNYPEGYFYKEEEELGTFDGDIALNNDPISPSINDTPILPPANRGGGMLNRPPRLPKRRKNPVIGNLPDSIISRDNDKKENDKDLKNDSPDKLPDLDEKTAKNDKDNKNKKGDEENKSTDPKKNPLEEKTAKTSGSVEEVEINRKPLYDFADEVLAKVDSKKVDLSQQFLVRMDGEVTKDGKLNRERSRFTEQKGNQEMINVAKRGIESVGDSGWLDYLSRFDVKKVSLVFAQNDAQIVAVVDSELPTPERAQTVASGLKGIIQATLLAHNNGWKKLQEDEVVLLKAANVTNQGKTLKINFNLAKPIAQKLIDGRLNEYRADKLKKKPQTDTKPKPNGTAKKPVSNSNSAK